MLNGRLYWQAWFVATLALLVAFLTLRSPESVPTTTTPAQFAGSATTDLAARFREAAPLRVPGTVGAAAGERWITDQFSTIPGDEKFVTVQRATVRHEGRDVPIANVIYTVPARATNRSQRRILVVAPRDAPRQVSGGTSSTAILAELARLSVQRRYHHPIVFVSIDGDTLGNAGFRWYLSREVSSRIAGVIVLDAPGEGRDSIPVVDPATGRQELDPSTDLPLTAAAPDATTMYLWSSGAGRQALDMRRLAERAVAAAGFTPSPLPSLRTQLLELAFTETRGAQRAAIDRGIPAVTLSARPESPLPVDVPEISRNRVRAAGVATLALIGLLDDRERANVPDRALVYAGRILRPSVASLALLFVALPIFMLALDAASRVRRSRVRLTGAVGTLALRAVPALVALLLGWLLTQWGVLRAPLVGRPASPVDLPFDGEAALALLLIGLSVAALVMLVRPRVGNLGATDLGDAAAALVVLSVTVLVAWWYMPFSLVVILPLAHAVVAATMVPRLWHVGALALAGLVVPLALLRRIGDDLERGPLFTLWYVVQTTLSGARGLLGPLIAASVVVCLATLVMIVIGRAREGLVPGGDARQGLARLTANLSARKRASGASDGAGPDGTAAEEAGRRPLTR